MARKLLSVGILALSGLWVAAPARAGVTVFEKDGTKIEIGGRIQIQYLYFDPDGDQAEGSVLEDFQDDLFFRRLRPYMAGTFSEDWFAKIEYEFGQSLESDEVQIKDAYIRYLGWKDRGIQISLGNVKTPFSREFAMSSLYLQMIERSFAGDHNFGAPDRMIGALLEGEALDKKITYAVMLGQERHDPDVRVLDFDSPANSRGDWNQGPGLGARIDWHPRGNVPFKMGDFHTDTWKYTLGIGVFGWQNDDDNNTYTHADGTALDPLSTKQDVDEAKGVEVSAAVRGHGLSADVELHKQSADTVVSDFTGGIYVDGSTDLDMLMASAGYMLPKTDVELAVAWTSFGADGYARDWERTTFGVNWFWKQHQAKIQINYRMNKNVFGVPADEQNAFVTQVQFYF